jgi:cell division protein FtsB
VANAVELTEWVAAIGAAISAVTPIIYRRLQGKKEADATVLASFTALNTALGHEIERLRGDMQRMQADYEQRLNSYQQRISELEAEIATLNRLLARRDT